jgi:SOS-response transcriptional repressor LexA
MPTRKYKNRLDPKLLETIFDFICQHKQQFGYTPTMREISDACYVSISNLYRYLDQMETNEWIMRDAGRSRTIVILRDCPEEPDNM